MSLLDEIEKSKKEELEKSLPWLLGDYVDEKCENCSRQRVCICLNGKHRCEKCNWSPEESRYIFFDA